MLYTYYTLYTYMSTNEAPAPRVQQSETWMAIKHEFCSLFTNKEFVCSVIHAQYLVLDCSISVLDTYLPQYMNSKHK